MANKGHWISNDNGVKTGDEIWRFCKRFSLELKDPSVRITSPQDGLSYLTLGGEAEVPSLTLKATASDPDGQVVKVEFFDGKTLLAEFDKSPYTYKIESLSKGTHTIKAVVTDDEGRTSSSEITITVSQMADNSYYQLHKTFTNCEGCVPEGWSTYDGEEKRTGYSSGYSRGSRVFQFTGSKKDFNWGLYTRNINGKAKEGYARFADKSTALTMTLHPGAYQLQTRVTSWNQESLPPVTVAVETANGQEVFSQVIKPTVNIGNTATNAFSGSVREDVLFNITEKGRYVITFYTDDSSWADLVVGYAALRRTGDVTAVSGVASSAPAHTCYYSMSGQRIQQPTGRGPVIEQTRHADGRIVSRVVMK